MNKLLGINKMHWMGAQCTDSLDDWRSAYGPALLKSEGRPVMQCTRISSLSTESGENRWKWGGERLHTLSSVGEAGSSIAVNGSSSVMTVSSYFYTFTLMLNSFRNWSILILCDRYSCAPRILSTQQRPVQDCIYTLQVANIYGSNDFCSFPLLCFCVA